MKGKGIQISNEAYREGWERTFGKGDHWRDRCSYTPEELERYRKQYRDCPFPPWSAEEQETFGDLKEWKDVKR